MESFNVRLAQEYLSTFYDVIEDELYFNGYKAYGFDEVKHLRRMFFLGDDSERVLKEWCEFKGMTQEGWKIAIQVRIRAIIDGGYVFVPYIPLQLTPTILEGSLDVNRSLTSRYANIVVNNAFYGNIIV